MTEEEPESLDQVQHRRYRTLVARCSFLSPDRADITFIVNEKSQKMSVRSSSNGSSNSSTRSLRKMGSEAICMLYTVEAYSVQ